MNYQTPGVYVEEKSIFPPSVAQVETAIPAFIGYTQKGPSEPTKISSMLEYEEIFGGPKAQPFEVTLDDKEPYLPQSIALDGGKTPYLMHPALQMFFANGGGHCFIVSVGRYKDSPPKLEGLSNGIPKIRKVDEVTLFVIPEASRLSTAQDQYDLYNEVLIQCGELKDRFGIFDLREDDTDASDFRNGIGTSYLSYGAAYYPYLNTSLMQNYSSESINISGGIFDGFSVGRLEKMKLLFEYQGEFKNYKAKVDDTDSATDSETKSALVELLADSYRNTQKALSIAEGAEDLIDDEAFSSDDFNMAKDEFHDFDKQEYDTKPKIVEDDGGLYKLRSIVDNLRIAIQKIYNELINYQPKITNDKENDIEKYFTNEFESRLQELLNEQRMTLPPSSSVAGIYAKVDSNRGVWKSPANVSINRVSGPAKKLALDDNDMLNVDSSGKGKSVNAIRAFTGKGTLVWGARTLDGNSSGWRYISVRRFFNMVEESVKKSTAPFVFEPNDANTWVKVKAMIENYLTLQWRTGALMGAKPEQAFFVKVGLGETMTQQDVLSGKMIIEIGMAVVRPAEFIILRFSHKMLES